MIKTEQAAFRALEAIQLDKSIPLARRRAWQKVFMSAAQIVQQPIRGRGRVATVDRDQIEKLLKQGEGEPRIALYESIAEQCGCSTSYVAKVAKGQR